MTIEATGDDEPMSKRRIESTFDGYTYTANSYYAAVDVSFEKIKPKLELLQRSDRYGLSFVTATKEDLKEYWIFHII